MGEENAITSMRNGMANVNLTGNNSEFRKNTNQTIKDAGESANAQSGVSAAMNELSQELIANQLAHSINKAIINNAKTVAQQYLSIA